MKKSFCVFILVFLLSLSVVGCAKVAPDTTETFTEPQVSEQVTEQVSEENPIGNYFEINGVMRDIGDYTETEELFLMDFYENYLPELGILADKVFLYDSDDLTTEMLESRKGTVIIERCIGIVTDKETGDGLILNYHHEEGGYYIAYRNEECQKLNLCDGTVLVSYMVYDPGNNYFDDIKDRYDFVICREYED